MKITVDYSNLSSYVSSQNGDVFGLVNLDYDQSWPASVVEDPNRRFHVSRPTRNDAGRAIKGLPATARFLDDTLVLMTRDIQFWMHEMCWSRSPSMTEEDAKKSWRSLMTNDRFITNFAGNWTNADYVNGTLLNKEAMRLQPMTCGGAILKIIGETRIAGEDCYIFEAIDCFGDYRSYTPETHPYLFYRPNNSVRVEILDSLGNWTGKYRENKADPFPQYKDNSIIPVFAVGRSENYLPKWRIRLLSDGESFPSPFVP